MGSVALVLNPKTLHVSPQYHVVIDDDLLTVPAMKNKEVPACWKKLVAKSAELSADANYELAKLWSSITFGPDNEASVPNPMI